MYWRDTQPFMRLSRKPLLPAPITPASPGLGADPLGSPRALSGTAWAVCLLTRSRSRAPCAAGRRLGLPVAGGAVWGRRRPFLSAPGGGRLGAFTGHGRWGRVRAGSEVSLRAAPFRSSSAPAMGSDQPLLRPTKRKTPFTRFLFLKHRSTLAGPQERRDETPRC